MSTYRCPNCKKTFQHEDVEAIFCPHCPTTLCECILKGPGKGSRAAGIGVRIKTVLLCGLMAWIFWTLLLPVWLGPRPDAVGLILLGPIWCCVSNPLFRLFARDEYSVRTGIFAAAAWLFSFLFVLIVALASRADSVAPDLLFHWKTVFAFLPGGYIAYQLGAVEGWIHNLLSARRDSR